MSIRIHNSGKLIAGIGIENGWVIGHDLSLIKQYYDLGARYMTLAHTSNNDICDSSTDPTRTGVAWPQPVRPPGRGRDESRRHDGRRVARVEGVHDAGDGAVDVARDRIALEHDGVRQRAAQHGRRDAARRSRRTTASCRSSRSATYVKVQPAERDTARRASSTKNSLVHSLSVVPVAVVARGAVVGAVVAADVEISVRRYRPTSSPTTIGAWRPSTPSGRRRTCRTS